MQLSVCRGPGGPPRVQTPPCWLRLQERFVVHVTDVLAVSMMLGITAQVKEAGVAWDKGEKKSKHLEQARFCSGPGQRTGTGRAHSTAPRD